MEAEQQQENAGQERSRARKWSTAGAALTGTLIGAVAGLTGSVLGYYEAGRAREVEVEARRADIRRQAYVEFGTEAQDLATEMSSVRNFVLQYPNDISLKELTQQHNDKYIPALQRIRQAEVTVRLVGTAEARKWLARSVAPREAAVQEVANGYLGIKSGEKWGDEMLKAVEEFKRNVEAFMDHVDAEVL
ncbi:hypothetical protein AB0D46_18360 [Streptomyces sp. NPDC048383]|uniref:hypothetical protein n=1 Tax=Streptomyces sp. NPDC048383 TaxID=3155386 RepID=UPI00343AA597